MLVSCDQLSLVGMFDQELFLPGECYAKLMDYSPALCSASDGERSAAIQIETRTVKGSCEHSATVSLCQVRPLAATTQRFPFRSAPLTSNFDSHRSRQSLPC